MNVNFTTISYLKAKAKLKQIIALIIMLLVGNGARNIAFSQSNIGDNLTVMEIIKQSQHVYSACISYSDEGEILSSRNGTASSPHTFTVKLGRPRLYKIEWQQNNGFFVQTGAVWSAGDGNYLRIGNSDSKIPDMETTLNDAIGLSTGLTAGVPGAFFKVKRGNPLADSMLSAERKNDGKIGNTDCYVLVRVKGGITRTLWIGKQDFLIRQIESEISAATFKTAMEEQEKMHPEIVNQITPSMLTSVKTIEIHTNIHFNQTLVLADFVCPVLVKAK